jgi:hypothetical protein
MKSVGVSGMGIGFQRSWLGLHFKCETDAITPPEREHARARAREKARDSEKTVFRCRFRASQVARSEGEGRGQGGGQAICFLRGAQNRGDLRKGASGIARCVDSMCARR